jgi:hypothetical protein
MTRHVPLVVHQGDECLVIGEAEVDENGITTELVVLVSQAVLEALNVDRNVFVLVPRCN